MGNISNKIAAKLHQIIALPASEVKPITQYIDCRSELTKLILIVDTSLNRIVAACQLDCRNFHFF
jgi:hypothetical protein